MELDPNILRDMISAGEEQVEALRNGATERPFVNADYAARLDALEDRIEQQDAVLRHTLSMLIEWIEGQSQD